MKKKLLHETESQIMQNKHFLVKCRDVSDVCSNNILRVIRETSSHAVGVNIFSFLGNFTLFRSDFLNLTYTLSK